MKQMKEKVKKMEDRMKLAKTEIGKLLDNKDKADAWATTRGDDITRRKAQELEEYIRIHEDHFADQMFETTLQISKMQKATQAREGRTRVGKYEANKNPCRTQS